MLAIMFRNISNLSDVSDYEYQVVVGGGINVRVIEKGLVRGHRRASGWEALVRKLLKNREVARG